MKHAFSALVLSLAVAMPAAAQTATIVSGDKTHPLNVELVETKAAAEQGLAGRAQLPTGSGMLIDYRKVGEPLTPTMRGVTFDLDLLFLAPDGTIVGIIQHARAGSLRPLWVGLRSVAVLEIPSGQVTALGIKTGDKVRHGAFSNAG